MKENESRNKMHDAMTMFIEKSSTRSTMEIIDDYETVVEKYENSKGRKRKIYKEALLRLENEMKMAEMAGSDSGDSSDSSDSY